MKLVQGSLAAAVMAAQQAQRRMTTIQGLQEAARAVCEEARRTGCTALVAASDQGAALVGAALIMAGGDLKTPDGGESGPKQDVSVLVVESVAVTRTNIELKTSVLYAAGYVNVKSFIYQEFDPATDHHAISMSMTRRRVQ